MSEDALPPADGEEGGGTSVQSDEPAAGPEDMGLSAGPKGGPGISKSTVDTRGDMGDVARRANSAAAMDAHSGSHRG